MAKNEKIFWVGFDLGGTKMFAAVFNEDFKIIGSSRKKTKGYEGMDAGLKKMVKIIENACEDAGIDPSALAGIGVGCPGPIDLKKGILKKAPNLGWENAPLRTILEEAFQCPVSLGNDVDVGVLGEYQAGAAKGAHCALGIFPGTGIGAGCVYDGKIISGKNNTCFELGHIQVQPDGPLCGCGKHGCLEAVASRLAMAAEAAKAAYRGQAPSLLEAAGMDLANIRSGALKKSIEAGDAVVEQVIRDGARWIGLGAATMINLLTPDVIILGGGLVEALPDLFLEEVTKAARERAMSEYADSFTVKIAELGDDAGVTGSAFMVKNMVEGISHDESSKFK